MKSVFDSHLCLFVSVYCELLFGFLVVWFLYFFFKCIQHCFAFMLFLVSFVVVGQMVLHIALNFNFMITKLAPFTSFCSLLSCTWLTTAFTCMTSALRHTTDTCFQTRNWHLLSHAWQLLSDTWLHATVFTCMTSAFRHITDKCFHKQNW